MSPDILQSIILQEATTSKIISERGSTIHINTYNWDK